MVISTISVLAVMASLVISVMAVANSTMFEQSVNAIDNCDATSTCSNVDFGTDNTQTNNCENTSTCTNEASGARNTQNNDCTNVGAPGCSNRVNSFLNPETDDNTQSNDCGAGGNLPCSNEVFDGSRNIQSNRCESVAEASCFNQAIGDGNTQNTECVSVVSCGNQAIGTENDQSIDCDEAGFACLNFASGNDNVQSVDCKDNEVIICSNSVPLTGDRNRMDLHCKNNAGECSGFVLEGSDNTHYMDCDSVGLSGCFNRVLGNDNIQNMNCRFVGDHGCTNSLINFFSFLPDNGNNQNMDCIYVSGCTNNADGDNNNQNLFCARMVDTCDNQAGSFETPTNSNTQSTTCAHAVSCINVGVNTNVIANGASCQSNDPDTTTICQPGRTIIRPNS